MLTLQEIFDKALHGVRAQGGPSLRIDGSHCQYRGAYGFKCGVGHLIPDNAYHTSFDRGSDSYVLSLISNSDRFRDALLSGGVDVDDVSVVNFLDDLQGAHDRAGETDEQPWVSSFNENMRRVAQAFGLVYTEVA